MPCVNSGVILSAFLIFLVSMPLRLPVGTIFLSEKYSVSIRSKLLGAVTARLVTSSVVTATYWMVMPVSALNFSAMALSWFTAVPRYRSVIFSCAWMAGAMPVARMAAVPLSTVRRCRSVLVVSSLMGLFLSLWCPGWGEAGDQAGRGWACAGDQDRATASPTASGRCRYCDSC